MVGAGVVPVAARLGMGQAAHDTKSFFELFERTEYLRQFEATLGSRRPKIHHGAVRHIDACQPAPGRCRSLDKRGLGGNHRIQQRQGEGNPHAAKERPARQMFL